MSSLGITQAEIYLSPLLVESFPEIRNIRSCTSCVKIGVGNHFNNHYVSFLYKVTLHESKNSEGIRKMFTRFLEKIKQESYFIMDSVVQIEEGFTIHRVTLEFPPEHLTKLMFFKRGEYSKMYSELELQKYFPRGPDRILKILRKDKSYLPTFVARLNKHFNVKVTEEDMLSTELDLPPDVSEEILIPISVWQD